MSALGRTGIGSVLEQAAEGGVAVLAPMSGVTDLGFRRLAMRFGATLAVSEMVASDELVRGGAEARLRAEGLGIDRHMVQLAGCEPHWMAEGARIAEANGASIIDINMGCPAKRVTGGFAGSALMRDLDHACRLIEATVGATTLPVTLKMRLGWDSGSLNAPDLAGRAQALGVALVSVHGRTRQQFYKGLADWSAVAAVRAAISIPLLVNGDIANAADARQALARSGADGVMIGRAALGRPWLVGTVGAAIGGRTVVVPNGRAMCDAVVEHYEWLLSSMGIEQGVRHARKHIAAYAEHARASGCVLSAAERLDLVTTTQPARVIAIFDRLFQSGGRSTLAGFGADEHAAPLRRSAA